MTKLLSASIPLVLATLLMASNSFGIVLTFEDSVDTGVGPPELLDLNGNDYAGFHWLDFSSRNASENVGFATPTGISRGVVSPDKVLLNYGGSNARFWRQWASPFDFNSVYLTSAFHDGMSVRVLGFSQGEVKYDTTVVLDTLGPTLFTFDYLGVDKVQFSTGTGGVLLSDLPTTANVGVYVIDNLSVTLPAPDGGSSGLLLGATFVGLWFFRRLCPRE